MKLHEFLVAASIAALPWGVCAMEMSKPIEEMSSLVPTAPAPDAQGIDTSPSDELVATANPAPAASKPAASAAVTPAKQEPERRVRRQAERLDRPPYIRPM